MYLRNVASFYLRNSLRTQYFNRSMSTEVHHDQSIPDITENTRESKEDERRYEIFQKSLEHPDYFSVHKLFTVKDLFEARVHLGHKEGSMDERMKPFIFGKRLDHLIFDLDKTAFHLREALNFTSHIIFRDGIVLFVSRNPQHVLLVERTAKECKEFAQARIWIDGLFTNSEARYKAMTRLPDLCIFLSTLNDVLQAHPAVTESAKMLIPTVGIVDTNSNPNLITYPVPGNDDTTSAVQLYCKLFKQAILNAKQKRSVLGLD